MSECPDEKTILAFGRGELPLETRRSIDEHVKECDECRALVSAVVRSSFVDPKELSADPPSAGPQALVERPAATPMTSAVHPTTLSQERPSKCNRIIVLAALATVALLFAVRIADKVAQESARTVAQESARTVAQESARTVAHESARMVDAPSASAMSPAVVPSASGTSSVRGVPSGQLRKGALGDRK